MKKGREQMEFLIQIKSQENYSWQGTIHWLKENRKESFRSALEMIRLIDSVLLEQAEGTEDNNHILDKIEEEDE